MTSRVYCSVYYILKSSHSDGTSLSISAGSRLSCKRLLICRLYSYKTVLMSHAMPQDISHLVAHVYEETERGGEC
jgi:hypothetical protein